jgi:hypothetical protein
VPTSDASLRGPREFRLTDGQREQLLDCLKHACKHSHIDDLPTRLELSVRRLLYLRAPQHRAFKDLDRATWQALERLRGLLDGVLQIVGPRDAIAASVRNALASESAGFLRARSVSGWIEDLCVVHTGIETVLNNAPRRGPGSPGDSERKQLATEVVEALESYGERLTTGAKGNVARVLTLLHVPRRGGPWAAGERATRDVSKLVVEGMKSAAARRSRARRRGDLWAGHALAFRT